MELTFEFEHLRNICENELRAKQELGEAASIVLKHRLADLRAAATVKDLVAGSPRFVDGQAQQAMALNLRDGYIMVFGPGHDENPLTGNGQLDWSQITRVKILKIEVDNGGNSGISP